MSAAETGKRRSQRIQIDYYRKRGSLFWLRWVCAAAGALGAGVYAAVVMLPDGSSHLSTGPLSLAHASLEDNCRQCHQDFTPLASDALRIDAENAIQHTETACQQCHRVGNHHRAALLVSWKDVDQDCTGCHSEHLGRNHDLTAVVNGKCSQCHAQLTDVCSGAHSVAIRDQVTRLDLDGHGEFASLQSDSGSVRFDHHQHMLPGQIDDGSRGGLTLEMVSPTDRERYRREGQTDQGLVSLQCADCHQPEGNPDSKVLQSADMELGRYMKPVSYEQDCSACHAINPPGRGSQTLALPHVAPWQEIRLLLETKLAGLRLQGQARMPRDERRFVPIPGEGFRQSSGNAALVSSPEVDAALQSVQVQCLKCHDSETITASSIAQALSDESPPLIPARWLRNGLFDHAAHRGVDCRFCHAGAYPGQDGETSAPRDHDRVMIGGIETCTPCHRPTHVAEPDGLSQFAVGQPTWASDSCTECHRYHTHMEVKR